MKDLKFDLQLLATSITSVKKATDTSLNVTSQTLVYADVTFDGSLAITYNDTSVFTLTELPALDTTGYGFLINEDGAQLVHIASATDETSAEYDVITAEGSDGNQFGAITGDISGTIAKGKTLRGCIHKRLSKV